MLALGLALKLAGVSDSLKRADQEIAALKVRLDDANKQLKNGPANRIPVVDLAQETPPSFEKLDPLAEKIVLILAHNTDYITSEDVAPVAEASLPLCLFHLESMKRLKYISDTYSYHGRQWACDEGGRAYLAHHGLL
jgi:hypothetical protein